jgi:3-oxoacyl-[acyl-carrier protein] reductase
LLDYHVDVNERDANGHTPLMVAANTVAPGWIATGSQTPHEARQGHTVPVGRSAIPEEVAACIGCLASTEAAFVTGQVLVVDGGNSIAEERA